MPRSNSARLDFDDTGHRVEAIGSWDHGMEPYDIGGETDDHKVESVQEFMSRTLTVTLCTLNNGIKRIKETNFFNDLRLREDYNSHTEEIVAGEKMAVRHVVHQNSFEAPC